MARKATGTISQTAEGLFQARLPLSLDRKSLGVFPTREEAAEVLAAALEEIHAGRAYLPHEASLENLFAEWKKAREAVGFANVKVDGWRWGKHVSKHVIASLRVDAITTHHVRGLRNDLQAAEKKLSNQSVKHVLNAVRSVLEFAIEKGLVSENAAADVSVTRKEHRTEDAWTHLSLDEVSLVLSHDIMPTWLRRMSGTAIGSGLRWGELASMELRDVHAGKDEEKPYLFVRFGKPGKLPKNGKMRKVRLFGLALDSVRAWLNGELQAHCPNNPAGLLFPKPSGACWYGTKLRWWKTWGSRLGLNRRVRWHDFRHTTASLLLCGAWGRVWTLPEIRDLLGHSSVKVTERYAHLSDQAQDTAAKETQETIQLANELATVEDSETHETSVFSSAPGMIRTCDNWLRRPIASGVFGAFLDANSQFAAIGKEALEFAAAGDEPAFWAAIEELSSEVLESSLIQAALAFAEGERDTTRAIEFAQAAMNLLDPSSKKAVGQ